MGVDKIQNMEHPRTFRNNLEHPGTSNNYDNYEKNICKLNFGKARMTIWSAQIGQVTLFLFAGRTTLPQMNAYAITLYRRKSIEKYMRSLIIDDILSGGRNVSTA